MWLLLSICLLWTSQDVLAAVGDKSDSVGEVIELTQETLMLHLNDTECPWLVLLYSGVTTFTKTALENFKKAMIHLGMVYKAGSMNLDENPNMESMFTLLRDDDASLFVFGKDRSNPRVIQQAGSQWNTDHFISEALRCLDDMVDTRVEEYKTDKLKSSYSVVFTIDNFNQTLADLYIKDIFSPWLILFHCNEDKESKVLREVYSKASSLLFPKVRTATVDIDQNLELAAGFFDTLHVPTVMYIGHSAHASPYANPILPMPIKPSVAHIVNFALTERLTDLSMNENRGISPVMISIGDVPYHKGRVFQFAQNTTLHIFSRV